METLVPVNPRIASGIERDDPGSVCLMGRIYGEEVDPAPPTLGEIARAFQTYAVSKYRKKGGVFVVFMAVVGGPAGGIASADPDPDPEVHVCGGWVVGERAGGPVVHLVNSWPPPGQTPVFGQVVVRPDYVCSVTDFSALPDFEAVAY